MSSRSVRRRAFGLVGLAVAATSLVAVPVTAQAALATHLVINEAYGGGGNSGATWTHDFVELYNPTAQPISLAGMSLQYRSAGGTGTGFHDLTGTVQPGKNFLAQQAPGAGGSTPLPTPDDATGTLTMSGTAGTVALVTGTGTVAPTAGNTVDMVGWGSTTVLREGTPAPGTTNTTSVSRKVAGDDTDDNSVDFAAGAPSPTNAAGETAPPPTGPPATKTIAEIQGAGPATPLVNTAVTTSGVVTAAFPTGGFNGFYIQTGGPDTTPGASDGLFVYEPGFAAGITVGDSVEVEGTVKEFSGLTEIDATTITEIAALPAVVPNTELPGSACALPGTGCPDAATLAVQREELEGEAFAPTGPMTVTDAYDFGVTSSSFFGEIGIAAGSTIPLVTPTEVIDAQDTAGIAARTAYNDAHRVVLDDGSSSTYWNTSNTAAAQDEPLPWLTADHTVRVGAQVTFDQPVILDYRFGWKLQPQRQVVGVPTGLVTFEQDRPAAPAAVGGDLRLATFNVLNYFTTLGGDVPGCSAYVDRDDNPIATRTCSGTNGPRGAWNQVNFERQQAKIVRAINTMDADIVSLEELENSRTVDGGNRDEAIASLVAALNADAGGVRWAYAASPAVLPASEDVIRNGFIYDPSTVETVGESRILDVPAFDNAREPVAQVFKGNGGSNGQRFAVIANHFKSKGSGVDDGTGQGNANPDRVAQAKALVEFASTFAAEQGTDKVFLTGDFNAYSEEDPVQEIEAAGYVSLESTDNPDEESYSFAGTSGSLDHVFANAAAKAMVTGVDLWEINANESVYYQYSRYNYVGTDLYRPTVFASSDHNPEVVGIKLPGATDPGVPTTTVQAAVTPQRVVVDRTEAVAHVTVLRGDEVGATDGTVEVREGSVLIASAPVTNSVVNVKLPAFTTVGAHTLTIRYAGGTSTASETTVAVDVLRAASDPRAKAGKAKKQVKVSVDAEGQDATGTVKVKVLGKVLGKKGVTRKVSLEDGKAVVRLAGLRPGRYKVVVRYLGNEETERSRDVIRMRVRR